MFFLSISPHNTLSSNPNYFFITITEITTDQLSHHRIHFVILDILLGYLYTELKNKTWKLK